MIQRMYPLLLLIAVCMVAAGCTGRSLRPDADGYFEIAHLEDLFWVLDQRVDETTYVFFYMSMYPESDLNEQKRGIQALTSREGDTPSLLCVPLPDGLEIAIRFSMAETPCLLAIESGRRVVQRVEGESAIEAWIARGEGSSISNCLVPNGL